MIKEMNQIFSFNHNFLIHSNKKNLTHQSLFGLRDPISNRFDSNL